MATNAPDCYPNDFLEQILAIPSYPGLSGNDDSPDTAVSQLSSAVGGHLQQQSPFPSGLSLDKSHGHRTGGGAFAVDRNIMTIGNLFPTAFGHLQTPPASQPQLEQAFQGQPISSTSVTAPHPPVIRPRVRARRGQATDPHSIAERLRRERITDRIKALQELVPSCNKTDRAAMLDEILDYVKFLRLQVKVLSMSRLGGAGAVAQLVANIPLRPVEMDSAENECNRQAWEKWSNEEIEQEVVKLMEEDVGAAMQFLQSKALCIMPISLAALIYPIQASYVPPCIKPEPPAPL